MLKTIPLKDATPFQLRLAAHHEGIDERFGAGCCDTLPQAEIWQYLRDSGFVRIQIDDKCIREDAAWYPPDHCVGIKTMSGGRAMTRVQTNKRVALLEDGECVVSNGSITEKGREALRRNRKEAA